MSEDRTVSEQEEALTIALGWTCLPLRSDILVMAHPHILVLARAYLDALERERVLREENERMRSTLDNAAIVLGKGTEWYVSTVPFSERERVVREALTELRELAEDFRGRGIYRTGEALLSRVDELLVDQEAKGEFDT